jgi:hypothetical protein
MLLLLCRLVMRRDWVSGPMTGFTGKRRRGHPDANRKGRNWAASLRQRHSRQEGVPAPYTSFDNTPLRVTIPRGGVKDLVVELVAAGS